MPPLPPKGTLHHWPRGEGRQKARLKDGKSRADRLGRWQGYASAMPELVSVVIQTARTAVSRRYDLILENLLLRHQIQVAPRLPALRRGIQELQPDSGHPLGAR